MRIITDSAADFSQKELKQYQVVCVDTSVMIHDRPCRIGKDLSVDQFWQHVLAGEAVKTSQPAPERFLHVFQNAIHEGEEAVCITVSSGVSGTIQSAKIAADMMENDGVRIVDSLNGTAGQKLLVMYACRLRDEGVANIDELVGKLQALRKRICLFASLDTLENLGRSGRIPKALASLGTLAQLKPLLTVNEEGHIVLCGKAFGKHRAIDSLAKRIAGMKIDRDYPVIPFFSYDNGNCQALIGKLKNLGVSVDEALISAIGPSIGGHIGPNAYGVAFVEAE